MTQRAARQMTHRHLLRGPQQVRRGNLPPGKSREAAARYAIGNTPLIMVNGIWAEGTTQSVVYEGEGYFPATYTQPVTRAYYTQFAA